MMLKERVMDPRQKDDISEALATVHDSNTGLLTPEVPMYVYHWYPPDLKKMTIGSHSRLLVGFTRFYPTLEPKVVVDFEPAPPERFWEDEKRRFCVERGIVYLPIYLGDKMDVAGFVERYRAARRISERGFSEHLDDKILQEVSVEEWMQSTELSSAIDAWALRRLEDEMKSTGKKFYGMSRVHVLRRHKQNIVDEIRNLMRAGTVKNPLDYLKRIASEHYGPTMDVGRRDTQPAVTAE